MPASTTVTGMVLSAMPVGDYDKRLVILTIERGKITAFAKGARRQNSALLACSNSFSFGKFDIYQGRSSYSVISADISNYFSELRKDIEGLYYAFYFNEFVSYITKENNDEKEILKLLYQTLRMVVKRTVSLELIKSIFELKILALSGIAPQVYQCVRCDVTPSEETKNQFAFSVESDGILCGDCRHVDKSAIFLTTSTLYTMQYIISIETEKLYTFTVTEDVLRQLQNCVKRSINKYIGHSFKSLEMLKIL